jgi:arginase
MLVPYDSGYYRKRMGLGPEQIFANGLEDLFSRLRLPIEREEITLEAPYPAEISAAFQLAGKLAERVRECRSQGVVPVVLSGNCNAALGTVSGCGANEVGIVWFDAHGEATTPETTVSGFLDGMSISTLLGRAWHTLAKNIPGFAPIPGSRIVLFGARDVEPAERSLLEAAGVQRAASLGQLQKQLPILTREVNQVYLHVDLDVLDPKVATANQWTPPNGITLECLLDAIAKIRKHTKVVALGIGSYDPELDRDRRALAAALAVAQAVFASGISSDIADS